MDNNADNKPVEITKPEKEIVIESEPVKRNAIFPPWLYEFKIQAIIIAVLAFVFYCNTFQNEFAFDDNMVILRNEYVLQGVAGISDILTKDSYDSYFKQNLSDNPLGGGRYRPLSIITFAIEQQFLGTVPPDRLDSVVHSAPSFKMQSSYEKKLQHDMHIRHVFNVLWFTLSVIVLLYFLRHVLLKNNPVTAFLAVVLFTIHPIHTEVVANVKSRDEILSLLFICLTFIFAFRYREYQKKWLLGAALVCYFLAFLSKEYAITLLLLLPLAFNLFNNYPVKKSLIATLPYLAIATVYIFIRFLVVHPLDQNIDNTIQNNSYAYAAGAEKMATKIATSLNYLKLLVFPHPLSSDYSYNAIPYKDFSHPLVWLSIIIHLSLIVLLVYFIRKRRVLSFAIAFYLSNLLLVNNFLFNIGATMGERLIYHSSVGFAIAFAYLLYYGLEMIKPVLIKKIVFSAVMIATIVLCGFKTIKRNAEWKNNFTLITQDVKVVPNSFLMNGNLAINYMNKADADTNENANKEDLQKALEFFNKAISVNDVFIQGYFYRGLIYFRLNQPDSALLNLDRIMKINPDFPDLASNYFNIGVLFYKSKQYSKALYAWKAVVKINPGHMKAQNAINYLYNANLVPKQ